ncbi:uncharacterized protein LOC143294629 [Babylonia areolata]|uniref:uncharacterized protein LOC143294629 n=1 Tax=Babylonia areolata TaxID=304850 RepID=UPI003FD68793
MASKCRKFVPNMFNKTKCQACFGSKEAHSAAALENNKATRKVSKCGYLFVAPNFDFSNPLDRTRRWQRRFFRLYDDGELTFCVDDHMDTVPQGSLDMNKCTDILEAEVTTSHCNSLAVVTPEKTEYIKADSKEEIQWWQDVLIKFPNSLKALKTRRKPNYVISNNKENVKPSQNEENAKKPPPAPVKSEAPPPASDKSSSRPPPGTDSTDSPALPTTFRGVRSLKHKADKDHQEGLRKSSSLHDLTSSDDKDTATSLASSRFLSSSGDQLDALDSQEGIGRKRRDGQFSTGSNFRVPRNSCPSSFQSSGSGSALVPAAPHSSTLFNSSSSLSSTSSGSSGSSRAAVEDRPGTCRTTKPREQGMQGSSREGSVTASKDVSAPPPMGAEGGERRAVSVTGSASFRQDADDLSQSLSADETDSNETDELKMARSSELGASSRVLPSPAPCNPESPSSAYEDLVYMKKGWLIKQTSSDRESRKHWFVLAGNALCYYRDAKAEENNNLDGRIDLSTCSEVSEVSTPRNYGVKIKTANGEYILAAMTAGIRSNWMKALRLCMDLHSSTSKLPTLASSLVGKAALPALCPRAVDDFDVSAGASALTTATTGTKGEMAFQVVGRRDPVRKETRSLRRHHSEASPSGGGKLFSVAEFVDRDVGDASPSASASSLAAEGPKAPSQPSTHGNQESESKPELSSKTSRTQRYSSSSTESIPWSPGSGYPLKRYVEGSDGVAPAPVLPSVESRRSKRNISCESSKEEEKRETAAHPKSPSTRVKDKSRGAKTPRLHSPPPGDEDFECRRSSGSQVVSDDENDLNMTVSSEENYHSCGDAENQEDSHSGSLGEGSMMVEILESEVESLKERLDQTQSELVKMHETNIDLKTRLQKETAQITDSGYGSGRWSQSSSTQQGDASQTLKRQLKESRDVVQKQRVEIESLKSKLDMSVSKLTGTEKALSEALRDCKQEKDKFLKMSSEWNRRIRTLETQVKDSSHKQERIRESLLTKEREVRRLEAENKQQQQKAREQEREILKLKAVEHQYNQLNEQLDNRDRDLHHAHLQLHDKDSMMDKVREQFEQQVRDMESEFSREREDLESHLEEVKKQLHSVEERQRGMAGSMSSNLSDLLKEKDDIIAQLEEQLIEHDTKMVDMQEELQAEMGENSDLAHSLEILQEEKQKLQERVASMERQVLSLQGQVCDMEKDNTALRLKVDKLQQDPGQGKTSTSSTSSSSSSSSDPEKLQLEKTVQDLNTQIQGLQMKLMEKLGDLDDPPTASGQDDALCNLLLLESDLKEVNSLIPQLQNCLHSHMSSLRGEAKQEASCLVEMVREIGQKCMLLQGSLQESSHRLLPDDSGADYHHTITATASSSSSAILEEYCGLKTKYDRVVAEVKKLKKEVNELYTSYGNLEKEDKQRQETVKIMEQSYSDQVKNLGQRVDGLTKQLATYHSGNIQPAKKASVTFSTQQDTDTEQMLCQIEGRVQAMEQTLAEAPSSPARRYSVQSGQESSGVASRLQEMRHQLDNINSNLKDILKDLSKSDTRLVSDYQDLASRLDECGGKLIRLTRTSLKESCHTVSPGLARPAAGHCPESGHHQGQAAGGALHSANSMNKLQAYADRLSLEALVLVEMAHLMEKKSSENVQDPMLREVALLNSKVLSLHQKLDQEMTTMNVTEASADVLRVQADIIAEKIMVEGDLCSTTISASQKPREEATKEDSSNTAEPKVLAAEAIMRSQVDAYIGHHLDPSCDELWTSPSYLTTRSLVQGELTCALSLLKQQFTDCAHLSSSATGVRDVYLQRLKDRHRAVMEVAEVYEQKMTQAFAAIIFRDSEDLTIMEGSDSILDTVCSEISSVMEQHIQQCKVKVRSAHDTLTAQRWDTMVNQLREDRDRVLAGIRRQHAALARCPGSERKVEIPCQSLDSSISSFGEIMSLRSTLSTHLHCLLEQLKTGDSGLVQVMEEEEEEEEGQQILQQRLCSFVHGLAEALQEQAEGRQTQVQHMLTEKTITAASIPNIPHPKMASPYTETLTREAVFAAQTTFMICKLKLLHEQEMEVLKMAHPTRRYKPRQSMADSQVVSRDVSQVLRPLGEVVHTQHVNEMETLHVLASQVGRLRGVVGQQDWRQVEEQVRQLEGKVGEEVRLAEERLQVHVNLFREEQKKVEQVFEECQQERDHFEERCATLEVELHSISHEHDDEVERMRQDVATAVSAIRANEGHQSDAQLSDRVQLLTKQMALQKDMHMRFLEQLKGQVCGADKEAVLDLVDRQLTDIGNNTQLAVADPASPLSTHPAPSSPLAEDKVLKMEEELELLKKEKDEALAEETRNTKAALDAMRKAYEEELQQERARYRDCLLTMYNEDFVNEIRQRHRAEMEKTKEELKQVKAHHLSKCEDLKELEVKMAQTKQDHETHINQLVMSNSQLDEMVNQQIDRLKDFVKKRSSSTSSSNSTMEEELYDAQITIRVKDTELQKLRSQVKHFEDSLHRTTEEHRQTMTQYLQALKENQELRKEYHTETSALQDQLDKVLSEAGLKKPVKRAPSFQQRARSPSPASTATQRRDCVSTSTEHGTQDPSLQNKATDLKDLRRSKSSPSLPFIFNAKGLATAMKLPSKRDRRLSQKM